MTKVTFNFIKVVGLLDFDLKLHIRIWISVAMVTGMFLIGEVLGKDEIIFPEIAALTVGAWIAKKQLWEVNRTKIMVLMSISAVLGYVLSAFFDIPILLKIVFGFLFCALSLIFTRCTMLPMISACILPILMQAKSIVYPVSVIAMTAVIITVQWLLEKHHLRVPQKHNPVVYDKKTEVSRWIFLFVTVIIISAIAVGFDIIFLTAPPVIVTFCEFSYTDSKARKSPVIIFLIISFCACFGACARLLMCQILNMPITAAVFIVIIVVLYSMSFIGRLFPPAGALALLPFIIDSNMLFLYPFEVMAGSAIFITLSILFGKYIKKGRRTR